MIIDMIMNKYTFYYESGGESKQVAIHAPNEKHAFAVFHTNFGPHPEAKAILLRTATSWEMEQINNTGAPSPRYDDGKY